MKRAWIVVLLLAGTVGAQSDKNIGKSKPVKPGDVLVVSPTNTLTQIDIYLRRNGDGHLIYSKNGGPEFDIDEAYDRQGSPTPMPNMATGELPYSTVDYATVEEAVKHGKPGDCLAFNGAGRYRSVSCNAGGAYQIIARPTVGIGYVTPKRTGEFHPQCRYKLDNGDSELGDCPDVFN